MRINEYFQKYKKFLITSRESAKFSKNFIKSLGKNIKMLEKFP